VPRQPQGRRSAARVRAGGELLRKKDIFSNFHQFFEKKIPRASASFIASNVFFGPPE